VADFSLGLSTRPPRLPTNVPSDLRHDAGVADGKRWRAPGGWTVEIVHLTGTSDNSDGDRLRVCQYGFWAADVRTVAELEQWFPVADLEPELSARSRDHGLARNTWTCSPVSCTPPRGGRFRVVAPYGPVRIDRASTRL
jgi:hypothetical protein